MRQGLKTLGYLLLVLLPGTGALAITADSPADRFGAIPERNLFGLKAQPITSNAPAPSLPKIILTGITTILGNKRALMKEEPPPGSPGAKEQSLILTEGQREGNVEVLAIDVDAGAVKVNNSGNVMTLTFEKDGAKLPSTPLPAAGVGGVNPATGTAYVPPPFGGTNNPLAPANPLAPGNANPFAAPGGAVNPRTGTGLHTLPTRSVRLPIPGASAPADNGTGLSPTGYGPYPGATSASGTPTAAANQQSAAEANLARAILQELQKEDANNAAAAAAQNPAYPATAPASIPGAPVPSGNAVPPAVPNPYNQSVLPQ